jgi:hypothetical protein
MIHEFLTEMQSFHQPSQASSHPHIIHPAFGSQIASPSIPQSLTQLYIIVQMQTPLSLKVHLKSTTQRKNQMQRRAAFEVIFARCLLVGPICES